VRRLTSIACLVALLLAIAGGARAQDFKQKYVGKSSCAPDIQSDRPDFSLRLDKTRNTYLINRNFSDAKVLLIVQLKGENDKCGAIRDAVAIRHIAKEFQFSCFDPSAPGEVVVGTRNANDTRINGIAIEAWRIDIAKQTFHKATSKVNCTNESYAGSDDGSDLVEEAKKRASQGEAKEPGHGSQH
jgi:hypothetical protein